MKKLVISEIQKNIIDALECKGHFDIAEDFRIALADKSSRRKNKIESITIAGSIRDKLEKIAISMMSKSVGSGIEDMSTLLEVEFDRLEDKLTKMLTEFLEFRTNEEQTPPEEENGLVEKPEEENVKSKEFKSNNKNEEI